jgi:Xaa-Pro aminopeptidase
MLVLVMQLFNDMTRTIPVSGKFSDRQKPQCGLNVKKEATKCL